MVSKEVTHAVCAQHNSPIPSQVLSGVPRPGVHTRTREGKCDDWLTPLHQAHIHAPHNTYHTQHMDDTCQRSADIDGDRGELALECTRRDTALVRAVLMRSGRAAVQQCLSYREQHPEGHDEEVGQCGKGGDVKVLSSRQSVHVST